MLEILDLTVHYGQALALEDISLSIPDKGLTALVGPNGAGKTTTFKTIMRLITPTSGSVLFKGESLLRYKAHEVARFGISCCPEGRRPFPEMSVLDNLLIGGYILPPSRIRERLEIVFSLFPTLKQRSRQDAATLSGGEQQMMAIGRSLMCDPSLLLIDEPSLGLSPLMVEEVERIASNIKQDGVCVLMAEGNVDLIRDLADQVYVFDHGCSVFCGTISEIMSNGDLAKTYLGF